MKPLRQLDPITVAFAKAHCSAIRLDCLNCAYHEDVGFAGYLDQERVIDLPRNHGHSCPRCGNANPEMLSARPVYRASDERTSGWYGLAYSEARSGQDE